MCSASLVHSPGTFFQRRKRRLHFGLRLESAIAWNAPMTVPSKLSLYLVCLQCNAKMFSAVNVADCPRCGATLPAGVAELEPWKSQSQDGRQLESDRDVRLKRTMSHALRHNPRQYYLEMDRYGWVDIDHFALALRYEHSDLASATSDDLRRIADQSDIARFEVAGNRIRARYGHSISDLDSLTPEEPPHFLFHGTADVCVEDILQNGLLPMGRTFVHLTLDWRYANSVALAKSSHAIVLVVQALEAHLAGVAFRKAGEHVWLADPTPPQFVRQPQKSPENQQLPQPGQAVRPTAL